MLRYRQNRELGEKIATKTLSSGVKCYIIPKSGVKRKIAIIGYNYGSSDLNFETDKRYDSPAGTAHFIEHKLFSQEWGDAFTKLDSLGVSVNAFTDFNKTAYYFSGENNFYAAFEVLLNFVQNPHFIKEEIEKEKGIIAQEIKMYDDDNNWRVYFELLKSMYFYNGVKENIAGSVESIEKINSQVLYDCYNAFYKPENAVIVVVGDIDVEKTFEEAEKIMKKCDIFTTKRIINDEPDKVVQKISELKEETTVSQWAFGFKEIAHKVDLKELYGTKILLDILFGEGSRFYDNLYKKGILDQSVSSQYLYGRGYNASIISGISESTNEIVEYIKNEITLAFNYGIQHDDFLAIKNKHIGRFIRGFNSVDAICMSQLDMGMLGYDLIEAFEVIKDIDKSYLEDVILIKFRNDKTSFSIISNK